MYIEYIININSINQNLNANNIHLKKIVFDNIVFIEFYHCFIG